MKKLLVGGLVVLAVLAYHTAWARHDASPTEVRVLDLAEEYPATSLPGEADTFFAQRVAENTNGAVIVVPHFDASLGYKSRQQLDAVANGSVPLANSFGGALGDANAVFLAPSLPFLTESADDARLLYELARDYYECAFRGYNQKLLLATVWPPSGFWAMNPVTTVEEAQALRIRTYDTTGQQVMTALGATAITMSFSAVPAALQAGTINSVLSSGDGGAGRKLWQYLSAFTEINYAFPLSFTTINLDVWDSLDDSTKDAILSAAEVTQQHQWEAIVGRVQANYATMLANGMSITTEISPELDAALTQAAADQVAGWVAAAGDYAQPLLDKYQALRDQPLRRHIRPARFELKEFCRAYCPADCPRNKGRGDREHDD